MQTPRRRRSSWAVAASILAHLALLTAVVLQRPTLSIPAEPGGPPEAIIPVLILPRTPARETGAGVRPAPIQLHRRPQRNLPPAASIAPLVVPAARPAEGPAQVLSPPAPRAAPPPAPPDAVRATLRASLGCSETRAGGGQSREDRAGCLERFGRGARDAAYLPPSLSPEKRALLDQAGAAKMAQKIAAESAAPSARLKPEPPDYDGEPDMAANMLPPIEHAPSKRAARVLNRLPP